MVAVSAESLGTKESTERGSRAQAMGEGHATSWHPTARHRGGIWAALTNSLPRSVPRMGAAQPALPLLTGTLVAAKARPSWSRAERHWDLGGTRGSEAQVQAKCAGTRPAEPGERGPSKPRLREDGLGAGVGAQESCPPRTREGNFSRSPIVQT